MNPSLFPWMIALPIGASPLIYLAGRLGLRPDESNRRSWLVRGLSLLAMLATCVLFVISWGAFSLSNSGLAFNLESLTLNADGLSFLLAAMILGLGTLVVLFSGPYIAEEVGE